MDLNVQLEFVDYQMKEVLAIARDIQGILIVPPTLVVKLTPMVDYIGKIFRNTEQQVLLDIKLSDGFIKGNIEIRVGFDQLAINKGPKRGYCEFSRRDIIPYNLKANSEPRCIVVVDSTTL